MEAVLPELAPPVCVGGIAGHKRVAKRDGRIETRAPLIELPARLENHPDVVVRYAQVLSPLRVVRLRSDELLL